LSNPAGNALSDLAAAPGGEDRLAQAAELLAAEYERNRYNTYAALAREQSGAFTMCAIRAIATALSTPAPETAPDAGLVEALREVKAWVHHWQIDIAERVVPTESSLRIALAVIDAALSRAGERPHD
jgi:hypothetical protein